MAVGAGGSRHRGGNRVRDDGFEREVLLDKLWPYISVVCCFRHRRGESGFIHLSGQ